MNEEYSPSPRFNHNNTKLKPQNLVPVNLGQKHFKSNNIFIINLEANQTHAINIFHSDLPCIDNKKGSPDIKFSNSPINKKKLNSYAYNIVNRPIKQSSFPLTKLKRTSR